MLLYVLASLRIGLAYTQQFAHPSRMGVRLERNTPRNLLASLVYRINRYLPLSKGRKLDLMLDLAWVSHRLSIENAAELSLNRKAPNAFLQSGIKPDDRVLEIGCDRGQVLASIDAAERVGVDYNASAIAAGKKQFPELTLIAGEARDYLAESEPFDVVILSHVLEHVDRPDEFLASVKDRFDRIYVEVPDFDWTDLNSLRVQRKRGLLHMDDDHIAEFDRDELEQIFERLQLRIIDREFRHGVMRYWVARR
jgi:SAM-dependent methyltransferase